MTEDQRCDHPKLFTWSDTRWAEEFRPCPLCERDRLRAEVERLREVVTIPLITPEAPPGFYFRVLTEHEKGQPVNAQDLINALMWRVKNQRREIARFHEPLRKAYSDAKGGPEFDAP